MSDLIDRQKAIETLENLTCYGIDEMRNLCDASVSDSEGWLGGIKDAIDELQLLPSAEQERKNGKWQRRKGADCWECSECHAVLERDDLGQHNFYFCYHCGADMRDGTGYYNIEAD